MIVYGSSLSPFVRKVLAFAAEKGIEVENKPLPPGSEDPEFLAASPFGKIPALARRRFRDLRFERDHRLSRGAQARAEPDPDRPTGPGADDLVRRVHGHDPVRLRAARCSSTAIVGAAIMGVPGDSKSRTRRNARSCRLCSTYLEGVIPESGFLVEDRLTLADIAVASPFANFRHLRVAIDPGAPIRSSSAYVAAILARPSFAPLIERESGFLERFAA